VYVNSTVVDSGYLGLSLVGYGGEGEGDVDVHEGDLILRTKMSWVRGLLILQCGDGMMGWGRDVNADHVRSGG
jgi:hypothetical protein